MKLTAVSMRLLICEFWMVPHQVPELVKCSGVLLKSVGVGDWLNFIEEEKEMHGPEI